MSIEEELREKGFSWQNIHNCFCWYNLSRDFIMQLVAKRWDYRWKLENQLLMDMHGYSVHSSFFYQNMAYYISNGLAQQKQLIYYVEQIYQMYRQQAEREYNSRTIHRIVDGTGKVIDQFIL